MNITRPSIVSLTLLNLSMGMSNTSFAHEAADPLISMVSINQLEQRLNTDTESNNLNINSWDADIWLGKDLNKLWLKTEGEFVDGSREESEVQVLYSRAIAPYWDLQTGWRGDFNEDQNQHWFAVGLQGLAPYFFEIDSALFFGQGGQTALRIDAEYELMFTQKLILSPEVETTVYGRNAENYSQGSGLANIDAGLRLRYEIRREFAPYIGINWSKKYGNTADISRASGGDIEVMQWVAGVRAWF
ncbi:copper resistance protein B [Zhongshania sp.]|uniref:copper resistance protein B n=1 Tax=Zhongshania sp. TaxID=1971902 RepID=UPI00356B5D3E